MSGPIVRTGTTPEFWKNWDRIFGDKKQAGAGKKSAKKASTKAGTKSAKMKSAKKVVKKASGKGK